MRCFKIFTVNFLSIIFTLFFFEFLSYREILNRFPVDNSKFWVYNRMNQSDNDIEERFGPNHDFLFKVFYNISSNTEQTKISSLFDYIQKNNSGGGSSTWLFNDLWYWT